MRLPRRPPGQREDDNREVAAIERRRLGNRLRRGDLAALRPREPRGGGTRAPAPATPPTVAAALSAEQPRVPEVPLLPAPRQEPAPRGRRLPLDFPDRRPAGVFAESV